MGGRNRINDDHEHDNDPTEAARLDREYTGDSVNARTDELKDDLEAETEQLKREYVESDKPADSKKN